MAKSKFQQAMLIGIGIMVAIGFSGVFTYGNLVSTPNTSNQETQEIEAELPSQNYVEDSYNLSLRQQAYLAANNQVVFVNALYRDSKENYTELTGLPETFNNKVYVNSVNMSESTFATGTQAEAPSTLVVGDQRTQRTPYTITSTSTNLESVKSAVCSSMRDVSQFGATCYS